MEYTHPSFPGKRFCFCQVCRDYKERGKTKMALIKINGDSLNVCAEPCLQKVSELLKRAYPEPFPSDFRQVKT